MDQELNVEDILKYFREQVGAQAQEIAMLKAMNKALQAQIDNPASVNNKTTE